VPAGASCRNCSHSSGIPPSSTDALVPLAHEGTDTQRTRQIQVPTRVGLRQPKISRRWGRPEGRRRPCSPPIRELASLIQKNPSIGAKGPYGYLHLNDCDDGTYWPKHFLETAQILIPPQVSCASQSRFCSRTRVCGHALHTFGVLCYVQRYNSFARESKKYVLYSLPLAACTSAQAGNAAIAFRRSQLDEVRIGNASEDLPCMIRSCRRSTRAHDSWGLRTKIDRTLPATHKRIGTQY
jgi:hypothetical protein